MSKAKLSQMSFWTIMGLFMLIQMTNTTTIHNRRILADEAASVVMIEGADLVKGADNGKIVGMIVRGLMLLCTVLMWVDCCSRYGGKVKKWMALFRFIIFFYGSSCFFLIGDGSKTTNNSFRGGLGPFLSKFFGYLYNGDGYFGSGVIKIFPLLEDADGNEMVSYWNYFNILFIEIIIYIILRIVCLAIGGALKDNKPWAHLISSIFNVYAFCWAFPLVGHCIFWFKQHSSLIDANDAGATIKISTAGFWITYIIAILIQVDMCLGTWHLWANAMKGRDEALGTKPKNYTQANNQAGGADGNNETTFKHDPSAQGGNAAAKGRSGCSDEDVVTEMSFMHMKVLSAAKSPIATFYNAIWFLRYVILAVFAISWWNYPRTMGWIFIVMDIGMIVLTILVLKSMNSPAGILILVEEILLFVWHLFQLILLHDQFGKGTMAVGFFYWMIIICFILTALIELVLMVFVLLGVGSTSAGSDNENLNSEDVKLDDLSNNELENKIATYNTMKSGRSGNDNKAKNPQAPQNVQNPPQA